MHSWLIYVIWEVELVRVIQNPSSFTLCPRGVIRSPVPPRAVVLHSPLGISINAFSRRSFLISQFLAVSQNLDFRTTLGQRVYIQETVSTLYSEGRATRELIRVWGILVHPSPLSCDYLQPTSFIGRFSQIYIHG